MNKYVTQTKHTYRRQSRYALRDVAKTPWSRLVVYVLCVSLLISPVERVMASEEQPLSDDAPALDPTTLQESPQPDESVSERDSTESSELPDEPSEPVVSTESPDSEETDSSTIDEQAESTDSVDTSLDNSAEEEVDSTSNTTNDNEGEVVGTSSASGTDEVEIIEEEEVQATNTQSESSDATTTTTTTTSSSTPDELVSTTSSSTMEVETSSDDIEESSKPVSLSEDASNEVVVNVTSDSQVSFDRDNCVLVEDGTYYCRAVDTEQTERPDGVYAYPDSDGDIEIYVQRDGELTQITFNTVEDAAPWYDSTSNTIVWHRSVNDRYQIISYDVDTQKEEQITSDSTNNMQPTRFGEYVAWQSWIDNNWEIVLFDGVEMSRITFSPEHDVAPQIRNGLLVWSRGSGSQQTAEIYNLSTKEYISIADVDGGIVSNPRMVLMYESRDSTGDTVVRGYDMVSGEIIPISSSPAQAPVRIPSPDATPEPRALIQPTVQKQEVEDEEIDDNDLEEDEDSVVAQYDFDSEDTLVLFDYGEEGDVEIMEEEMQAEEEFTLDLRPEPTPEEEMEAELTLVVPALNEDEDTEEVIEDDLTIMIETEEGR